MKPGDVLTCRSCRTTATAYTTGDPARWIEGKAVMISWHGYRHETVLFEPELCLPCANGEPVRPPPNRRVQVCDDLARAGVRLDGAEWRTDAELEEAFQRWIAAGRPPLVLVSVGGASSPGVAAASPPPRGAGEGALLERSPEAVDALERFEADAAAFLEETGMLAPGKDQPAAMNGSPSDEERMAAWTAWLRNRAAASPRPPPKPPKGTQLSLL